MNPQKIYIFGITLVFCCFAIVFLTFPRSVVSELEKRELAKFPEYSHEKLRDNTFTKEVSEWFSDSEPYRDELMALSMQVNDAKRFSFRSDEETVSFHAAEEQPVAEQAENAAQTAEEEEGKALDNPLANENAKIGHSGIIVVGKAPNARALMAFGGKSTGGGDFVATVNKYHQSMPGVNIYAMIIPLASEYYTPDKAKKATNPQAPFIENVYSRLSPGVKGVSAHKSLAAHIDEDIYLRTDHHWAPLGAFYAAQSLAKAAGVPFAPLADYTKKTVARFVGSMYGYSKDIAVKNSPETFVYYVPSKVSYSTTYRTYTVNSDYRVTRESGWASGPFFYSFKDGSGGAYATFMGSDMKLTKVTTGTSNGRRLLIIKDSYGNAVPGYMFYSFEEVHVVDFRYFTHNICQYVRDNRITDLAFVLNCFNAYSSSSAKKMERFLTQGGGIPAAPVQESASQSAKKEKSEAQPAPSAPEKKEETKKSADPVKETETDETPSKSNPEEEPAKNIMEE